jgi:hypothetical protein
MPTAAMLLALGIATMTGCSTAEESAPSLEDGSPDAPASDPDGSPFPGIAADAADAADATTADAAGGGESAEEGAPSSAQATLEGGDPAGGADDTPADPPQVEDGTDSALVEEALPVSEGARATVSGFADAYLAFDHRDDGTERIERLRPLATEDLLATLSQPVPPAMAEQLRAEERVVTAETLDVVPVAPDVYQAVVEVTTATTGQETTEQKLLTVVLGADGLVQDVR